MWGAIIGAVLGMKQNADAQEQASKERIRQLEWTSATEKERLFMTSDLISQNRKQLDEELGNILSESALTTAKDMATANAISAVSGTIGGTTSMVAKQAYMEQISRDADIVNQARNQDIALLTEALQSRVNYRNTIASAMYLQPSSSSLAMQNLSSGFSGAASGMAFQSSLSNAMSKQG